VVGVVGVMEQLNTAVPELFAVVNNLHYHA
jgi:hypothetical protein